MIDNEYNRNIRRKIMTNMVRSNQNQDLTSGQNSGMLHGGIICSHCNMPNYPSRHGLKHHKTHFENHEHGGKFDFKKAKKYALGALGSVSALAGIAGASYLANRHISSANADHTPPVQAQMPRASYSAPPPFPPRQEPPRKSYDADPNTQHYNTLGLHPGASQDEVRKAYKKLAMKHHPDKGGDAEVFKKINNAHHILTGGKFKPYSPRKSKHPKDHHMKGGKVNWKHVGNEIVHGISHVGKETAPIWKPVAKDLIKSGAMVLGSAVGTEFGNPAMGAVLGNSLGNAGAHAIGSGLKRKYRKGSRSLTHLGDLDFTSKLGSKVHHIGGHDIYEPNRPYRLRKHLKGGFAPVASTNLAEGISYY